MNSWSLQAAYGYLRADCGLVLLDYSKGESESRGIYWIYKFNPTATQLNSFISSEMKLFSFMIEEICFFKLPLMKT